MIIRTDASRLTIFVNHVRRLVTEAASIPKFDIFYDTFAALQVKWQIYL
ncbi:hypothetical protein [Algoriphagus sp.]